MGQSDILRQGGGGIHGGVEGIWDGGGTVGCVVRDGICEYACAGVRGEGGLHLDDGDGFEGV